MAFLPVPLALAAPALAATAAYVNARYQVSYDLDMLGSILPTVVSAAWWGNRGRINTFYRLEALATSKSSENRIFLRFEDKQYTYGQAYDTVLRYANWLKQHRGVKTGELVALDFQNTDTLIFLLFAVWSLGAIPALINYNLSGTALAHCVKRAASRLVLVDPRVAGNIGDDVRSELSDVSFEVVTPKLEFQMLGVEAVRPADELRSNAHGDDMGLLIFTSGTTGLPKAAIVSWAKIAIVGGFTARWIRTRTSDVYYTAMPLYHSTAMLMGLSNTLTAGATFAISRKFSTSHFWEEVRRHDANIIQYVGETCRYLLSAQPAIDPATSENLDRKHNVRIAFGNGLRPDVWNRFKERFGIETISEFYGATEGSFATWNLSRNDFSMGAVGRNGALYNLLLGGGIAIISVDHETELPWRDPRTGYCCRAKHGEPGELMFKLPAKNVQARFQGYYGDKDSSSKKIINSVFSKGDAWFRTGDVVRSDHENRLFFTDRIGDTFRWKSENVSTAEVAQAVGLHPAIAEANVYGIELPHHEGRAGCAAVILKSSVPLGLDGGPTAETLGSLAEHVRANLPKFALPLFIRVVKAESLQATGTNKQQKQTLRTQGVDPAKTAGDVLFWLRGSTYESFSTKEWKRLEIEGVKL